jgi:hypothetical protein
MSEIAVTSTREIKEASLEAVVIHADGSRDDLGVIAYYHRNPFKRWWVNRQIEKRR